jgi:hypothetical protein
MASAVIADALGNFLHSTLFISESRSFLYYITLIDCRLSPLLQRSQFLKCFCYNCVQI